MVIYGAFFTDTSSSIDSARRLENLLRAEKENEKWDRYPVKLLIKSMLLRLFFDIASCTINRQSLRGKIEDRTFLKIIIHVIALLFAKHSQYYINGISI